MNALTIWFATRSLREKRLLIVMVALAVVVVLWGGIVRPVRDGLSSSRERHDAAAVRLGRTEAAVTAIRAAGRPAMLGGGLSDMVRQRAEQAGFPLASLTEEGAGRVRATIASARPGTLTRWLASMEAAGVLVDQATMTDNGDRTVAATLVLTARGL